MSDAVILDGKRTPFGKFGGSLVDIPAIELGVHVLKSVISEKLNVDEINNVYMGLCLPGSGLSPARSSVLAAGWPVQTNAVTIDRACCSSLTAMGLAAREIKLGISEIVVAGGMENMSRTPYLIPQARWGERLGDFTVYDDLVIRNPYVGAPMAKYVGESALEKGVDRVEQDTWALRSNLYWAKANESGKFVDELSVITVNGKRGSTELRVDEHPRANSSLESLAKLKTVYDSPTVTAGNASGIADGAVAVVIASRELAKGRNIEPIASIVGHTSICGEPRESASMPGLAIKKLLNELNLSLADMKLIEINEAFAAMPIVSSLVLADFDRSKATRIQEKINVNGGAIAIGHPLGATGGRLALTTVHELRRRGGGYGMVAICGAMGQADAMVLLVD